jgi:hypothetical protein
MRRPAALGLLVLALGGCGLGAGGGVGSVTEVVTRDFGRMALPGSPATFDAPGSETAMRALERRFKVTTRYGGGFVESIDGLAGGSANGRPVDWFYYVNGIEAPKGAAGTELHGGDVIWWDHHDWSATQRVPAVVGAYPEPFAHGIDGERLPVRVECASGADADCHTVEDALDKLGVIAGEAPVGTRSGDQIIRVLVGPWPAIRSDFAARLLDRGPGASGVYARFSGDGRTLTALDPSGNAARTLGPGTGLVAATRDGDAPPVWIVTGTDAAGLAEAAKALTVDALRNKFAVAVRDDLPIGLPVVGK